MRYAILAEAFEKLEQTPSYLQKNALIVDLLKQTPSEEIKRVIYLLLGRPWPTYVSKETGVGPQQLKKILSLASGYPLSEVEELVKKIGDFGKVAFELFSRKRQVTLFSRSLTVKEVFDTIASLPDITGEGSMDRKIAAVAKLLSSASPLEAKFIVRTVLGDLRIGVAEGRLRDAIATAFNIPPEEIEHAYMLTTDYALVAEAAAKGEEQLKKLGVTVGHPVSPMLAQRAEDLDEILERLGGKGAFEVKLDGIRIQVHKDENNITLFTRRMEDYTNMFPDLIDPLRQALKPKKAIADGELVAVDPRTNKPMPFQEVLKRRRKYDIEKVAREIPIQIYLFDLLLCDKEHLMDRPYTERRKALEKAVNQIPGKVMVVEQIVSGNKEEIQKFLEKAIQAGHEGLLAKALDSTYRAGRREFVWLKLKPVLETLDLVVVGALYGKGKRAGYWGSYVLAARDEDTGRFKTVTKCGSGYTDEDLKNLTELLKPYQIEKPSSEVDIEIECDAYFEPKIVFETAFEEIQVSPEEKHTSGFGLRFPRFVRVREDRSPEQASTVTEIAELFELQERRKAKHGGPLKKETS